LVLLLLLLFFFYYGKWSFSVFSRYFRFSHDLFLCYERLLLTIQRKFIKYTNNVRDVLWTLWNHLNLRTDSIVLIYSPQFSLNASIAILIIVQRDATQSSLFTSIILQVHSTCFGFQTHPSSAVHKTVTTVFGTAATSLQLAWPRLREVAAQKVWQVPEAVVTVLCTPVDGCGWLPKHVEWTCRIINRLLCFASRWTVINIDQRCTEP
jgi:hypothetical protein